MDCSNKPQTFWSVKRRVDPHAAAWGPRSARLRAQTRLVRAFKYPKCVSSPIYLKFGRNANWTFTSSLTVRKSCLKCFANPVFLDSIAILSQCCNLAFSHQNALRYFIAGSTTWNHLRFNKTQTKFGVNVESPFRRTIPFVDWKVHFTQNELSKHLSASACALNLLPFSLVLLTLRVPN